MKIIPVVCAILFDQGRLLLARRPPGDALAGFWEFPGGKIEDGEDPIAALQRELREELGIEVAVDGFLGRHEEIQPARIIRLEAWVCRLVQGPPVPHFHDSLVWAGPGDWGGYLLAPADRPLAARVIFPQQD